MNNTLTSKRDVTNKLVIKPKILLIAFLAVLMLAVFINPEYSIFCGPVMTLIFVYLFFGGYQELVTAIIIVANDALGTMVAGKLSFQYLLLVLIALRLLMSFRFAANRRGALLFLFLLFPTQLFVIEFIDIKRYLFVIVFLVGMLMLKMDKDPEVMRKFFAGVAFAVIIISIHAMLTGGVEFYEQDNTITRKGILGVGIGDSNFSAFLLNFGIVCLLNFVSMKWYYKLACMIPMIYAFILTRSVSGFLTLFLAICVMLLFNEKKQKGVVALATFFIVLICAYQLYTNLSSELRIEMLDIFIERIEEKLAFAQLGDYASATTDRSELASLYVNYIFNEQSVIKLLFGGNPLIVKSVASSAAHNTFLDVILQFGIIGFIPFIAYLIYRFVKTVKETDVPYKRARMTLKVLCIFGAIGLSIYADNVWTMWMVIMFLI